MKRIYCFILALICASLLMGQDKQVAVLQPRIIGNGTVSTNDQLIVAASMRKAFTEINGYEAYTRTSQSLIAAELAFQNSGFVDDKQIKEVGMQTGVAYICVFTLSKDGKELVVNSEIINVVTAKIENSDFIVLYDISDREKVTEKCQELAYNLLGVKSPSASNNNSGSKKNNNIDGININGVIWATKNVGAFDASDYGNYYYWEKAQNVCPSGWRLPTEEEFLALINEDKKSCSDYSFNFVIL